MNCIRRFPVEYDLKVRSCKHDTLSSNPITDFTTEFFDPYNLNIHNFNVIKVHYQPQHSILSSNTSLNITIDIKIIDLTKINTHNEHVNNSQSNMDT